jgi:hypothetical protein
LGAGATLLIAGAVLVAGRGFGGREPAPDAGAAGLPTATAPVTRATLSQTERVHGVLGYGTGTTVAGHRAGTLTWLPTPSATVTRGQPAYRVDDLPVSLLYGTLPLYRPLREGVSGGDVREVEQNLSALGYTGFTVDDDYTAATAAAVTRWQDHLGLPGARRTGIIDPSDVVLAPGAVRIADLSSHPGDPASGALLTYTGTTRTVDIPLDVALQDLVRPGAGATVTLPDGATVAGTVATVGRVATAGSGGNPATIEVTVGLADQSALGNLDAAPVDVDLVSAHADNVLTVPIAALVALAEGGYGVQLVTGSTSRYVAVQTGMFANGRVQVAGDGITAGAFVGVPR